MKTFKQKIITFVLVIFLILIGANTSVVIPVDQSVHTHTHEYSGIDTTSFNKSNDIQNSSIVPLSQTLGVNTQYELSEIDIQEIDNSDAIETISRIEEELQEQGTSIIAELYNQYDYYQTELSGASSDRQENILMKLAKIDQVIAAYEMEYQKSLKEDSFVENDIESASSTYIFGISPNCTCEWWNYQLDSPCWNCQLYYDTMMAVTAIAVGFSVRGWSLAADLVWHSMSNNTLDSYYTPNATLVNRVAHSPQILDEVAHRNLLTEAFEHATPGRLNGLFVNTLEGDIYNSIGSFYYSKNYAGNGNINISILDRYDYKRGDSSPGGILINIMVTAQEIGVSVPFYTKIDITVPGTASLSWEYTSTEVSITGASNNVSQINIPNQMLDLRVKSLDLPKVDVTKIVSNAFANHTQLSQVTIPSSVTHIGSDAFKNTNNARIYLNGRIVAPSTFDLNWNSAANPVYLNGVLCNHSSKTTIELNATQHGDLCNSCRTIINKANHNKYTSGLWEYCHNCLYSKYIGHTHTYNTHTWLSLQQHESSCSCGSSKIRPHVVSGSSGGFGYETCLECGGPAEFGIVMLRALVGLDDPVSSIYIEEYFGNGSFVLSNGVIVLSDEDLELYYNGTLVLPYEYNLEFDYHDDCYECHNCLDDYLECSCDTILESNLIDET